MTKLLLAATTVLAALAAAPNASAQDWTGLYVGGHLGYATLSEDDGERLLFDTNLDGTYGDTVRTGAGADAFSPGFCDGAPKGNNAGAGCEDDEGGVDVGLRAGYDWALAGAIVGVVGEVSTAEIEDSVTGFSSTPAAYAFKRELNTLAAVRARVGLPIGPYLGYATGGYAWGDLERSFATTNVINSFTPRGGDDATGYQLGLGVERQTFGKFSLGAEYLYTSLEDDGDTVRFGPGTAPVTNPFRLVNPAGTDVRRSSDRFEFHSVRLTLSYRFS